MNLLRIWLIAFIAFLTGCVSNPTLPQVTDMNKVRLVAPNYFEVPQRKQWESLEHYILTTNYKIYTIVWAGHGGMVYMSREFIEVMDRAKSQGKQIVFDIVGNIASMHSMVACYASARIYHQSVYIMYHSIGFYLGHTYYRDTNAPNKDLWDTCISKNMITNNIYNTVESGHEVYVFSNGYIVIKPDKRPLWRH